MIDHVADLAPVHFVGIGGAGMSALATILLQRGLSVSGSDIKEQASVQALRARGASIVIGHDSDRVVAARTLVVSTAIRASDPEVMAARNAGIPVMHRAQLLGLLMRAREGVAVAGTHGKTTTTSMIALIGSRAGLDPTFVIGGELNERGTNAHDGSGRWLVAEADESDASFLWLSPTVAVVTNVELEHLEHYRDEQHLHETFAAFLAQVRPGGTIVMSADDAGARAIHSRVAGRVVTFGLNDGDLTAERRPDGDGQSLTVRRSGETVASVPLLVPGEHNARNALAAFAAAEAMGIGTEAIVEGLRAFEGVRRRFQRIGVANGVEVIDEYAHHPTEVAAAIATARERVSGRVIAVFQPHLYSRTRAFAPGFAEALDRADAVFVMDVYGAREDPQPGVTGRLITDAMRTEGEFTASRAGLAAHVAASAADGDLIMTIGAGDVTMLAPEILRALEAR